MGLQWRCKEATQEGCRRGYNGASMGVLGWYNSSGRGVAMGLQWGGHGVFTRVQQEWKGGCKGVQGDTVEWQQGDVMGLQWGCKGGM